MMAALLVWTLALPQARPSLADEGDPAQALQEQEPEEKHRPSTLEAPLASRLAAASGGGGFLDFDWLEVQPRVGVAVFSDDFRIDPSPALSLLLHAPMPWLSPPSDPEGEYFGAYLVLTAIPQVERDLDPPPDKTKGAVLFVGAGLDYTVVRNQALYLVASGGGQYASYGGISDLSDGFAATAGLSAGLYLGGGLTLTLSEETVFADSGNYILLGTLGLLVEF